MHDGAGYVVAAYGTSVVVLATWFWMIARRLRATRPAPDAERGDA